MAEKVFARFDADPPLGTRLMVDDQAYELVASEPYTRTTDGQPSRLLTWETACPHRGCGDTFRLQSGLAVAGLRRRCQQHRAGLRPVKGRRGRKVVVKVELA